MLEQLQKEFDEKFTWHYLPYKRHLRGDGNQYYEELISWIDKNFVPAEPLVMPKIAGIIQQAAKDWDVKVIGGIGVPRTEQDELIEKCANMQIQQFALYVEQKIFESNFTA